jgi:hypothetical protein
MAVKFTGRVNWPENELLLDAKKHKVDVPTGLREDQVRVPNYVDITVMNQKAKERDLGSSGLAFVNGLVTRELEVQFADSVVQWKRLSKGSNGPGQFQFQGGEIYLDLRLAVYVLDYLKPDPQDVYSMKIFALIYGHELLHVLDENEVLQNWLPSQLNADSDLTRLLTQPFTYGRSADAITVVERQFYDYIRSRVHGIVRNDYWAAKTNENKNVRDSPAEYAKAQEALGDLRAQQSLAGSKRSR